MPATILEPLPEAEGARAYARLRASNGCRRRRAPEDWDGVLDVIGDAPFLAAEADPKEIPALGAETRRTLEEMEAGAADPVATAERWHRSETALRLRCFENWLTDRIQSPLRRRACRG